MITPYTKYIMKRINFLPVIVLASFYYHQDVYSKVGISNNFCISSCIQFILKCTIKSFFIKIIYQLRIDITPGQEHVGLVVWKLCTLIVIDNNFNLAAPGK